MMNLNGVYENCKRAAAYKAVDDNVRDGMILGIGSGTTIIYVIERLIEKANNESMNLVLIPTSFQTKQLLVSAASSSLRISDLESNPIIDLTIDGADEVDNMLHLIKGGGGCSTQEKIVASVSKRLIIVVDYSKKSSILGEKWRKGIPLEVIPMAYVPVMKKIEKIGGIPKLRMSIAKVGPVITENGGVLIDADFGHIHNPEKLNLTLKNINGVVETGLFVQMTDTVYFGNEDGTVTVKSSNVI